MRVSKSDAGLYYKYVCPVDVLHLLMGRAWLGADLPVLREWGNEHLDGHFTRYATCATAADLRALVANAPTGKLNVGAQYSAPAARRTKERDFAPMGRELVFDLDLDESGLVTADDLEGCDALFPLVAAGLEAVRAVLRGAFGFQHVLFVYSGRRGAHLWVCDERAFVLSNEERAAVLARLQGTGAPPDESGRRRFRWATTDQTLRPAVSMLRAFFKETGVRPASQGGLGLLDARAQQANFLRMVGAPSLNTETLAGPKFLKRLYRACSTNPAAMERLSDAILTLVWPRLDANVSTDMKHLLKAPFSLHPKTGRVSLPVLGDARAFAPALHCPTAAELIEEATLPEGALRPATAALNAAVAGIAAFVDELVAAPLVRRTSLPVARLIGVAGVAGLEPVALKPEDGRAHADLRSGPSRAPTPLLANAPRRCWQLLRSFTAASDPNGADQATTVRVSVATVRSCANFCHEIPAQQMPPFRGCEMRSLEARLDEVFAAVRLAFHHPGTAWSAGEQQVLVVVKDADVAEARAHFERLASELSRPYELLVLRSSWDEVGCLSAAKMRLGALLCTELTEIV